MSAPRPLLFCVVVTLTPCLLGSGCRDARKAKFEADAGPAGQASAAGDQAAAAAQADDRTFWRYAPEVGGGHFRRLPDGRWEETGYKGDQLHSWEELGRTPEYVELYDRQRDYKTRLGAGQAWFAYGREGAYRPSPAGDWERPNAAVGGAPGLAARPAAADRNLWRYSDPDSQNFFRRTPDGTWEEWDRGRVKFRWSETARTPDYVELHDTARKYTARLDAGRMLLRGGKPTDTLDFFHRGGWERPGGGPRVAEAPQAPKIVGAAPASSSPPPPQDPALVALFEKAVAAREARTRQTQEGLAKAAAQLELAPAAPVDPDLAAKKQGFASEAARQKFLQDMERGLEKAVGSLEKILAQPGDGLDAEMEELTPEFVYGFVRVGQIGRIPTTDGVPGLIPDRVGPGGIECQFGLVRAVIRGVDGARVTPGSITVFPGIFRVTGSVPSVGPVLVLERVDLKPLEPRRAKAEADWRRDIQRALDQARRLRAEAARIADKVGPDVAAEAKRKADAKAEQTADAKLTLAKALLADGKRDKARQRLSEVVKDYPGTKAAAAAAELLKNP
jgi:hypothetical protein